MNTFYQECIIHVHVYLKVHWIQAVLKNISILFYYSWIIFYQTVKDLSFFFSYSTYYIFIEQFFLNRHNVYMYMYLRSIIHVYVLPCTPPCSLVMALTNIACQKWGTKIWSLNTKEKMIEQRALTGNMN